MTEAEKIRQLVAYRLEQAEEALRSAEVNAERSSPLVGSSARGYVQLTMKRRTRLIASGFTALAMTFSLGEGVLASVCAPGLDATAVAAAEAASMHGMPCCGPAEMRDIMTASADDLPGGNCLYGAHRPAGSDHDGRDEAPCPFGPVAGAPGCGAAASFPAHAFGNLAASPESAMVAALEHMQHSPSFASTLFHPPKP